MTGNRQQNDAARTAERVARAEYGKLIAILAAQDRDIAAAEDALSDALVAALRDWPINGVPHHPEAWLVTAARNRLRNTARATAVRRRAEPDILDRLRDLAGKDSGVDQRLRLLFVCAHPALLLLLLDCVLLLGCAHSHRVGIHSRRWRIVTFPPLRPSLSRSSVEFAEIQSGRPERCGLMY